MSQVLKPKDKVKRLAKRIGISSKFINYDSAERRYLIRYGLFYSMTPKVVGAALRDNSTAQQVKAILKGE